MTHNGREIIIAELPETLRVLKGFCTIQEDSYIIGIDNTLPDYEYNFILGHELAHIYCGHLDNGNKAAEEQEAEANNLAWTYYRRYRTGELDHQEPAQRISGTA